MRQLMSSRTARAMASPSSVPVPRPTSSRMSSERAVAWCRIAAVSTISIMKVDWPRARSSWAPTRVKMRSTRPTRARCRRHPGADLGQEHDQRGLPQPGALAAHVRPGDDRLPRSLAAEMAVVGDERLAAEMRLDHRVAAGDDLQDVALVDVRRGPGVAGGHFRQGQQRVELGQGARRRPADAARLGRDQRAEPRQRLPLPRTRSPRRRPGCALRRLSGAP